MHGGANSGDSPTPVKAANNRTATIPRSNRKRLRSSPVYVGPLRRCSVTLRDLCIQRHSPKSDLNNLQAQLAAHKSRLEQLESKLSPLFPLVSLLDSPSIDDQALSKAARLVDALSTEITQRLKCKQQVIIHNVSHKVPAEKAKMKILQICGLTDQPCRVTRLRRDQPSKHPPILLEFQNEISARTLINHQQRLALHTPFANIKVYPARTALQRILSTNKHPNTPIPVPKSVHPRTDQTSVAESALDDVPALALNNTGYSPSQPLNRHESPTPTTSAPTPADSQLSLSVSAIQGQMNSNNASPDALPVMSHRGTKSSNDGLVTPRPNVQNKPKMDRRFKPTNSRNSQKSHFKPMSLLPGGSVLGFPPLPIHSNVAPSKIRRENKKGPTKSNNRSHISPSKLTDCLRTPSNDASFFPFVPPPRTPPIPPVSHATLPMFPTLPGMMLGSWINPLCSLTFPSNHLPPTFHPIPYRLPWL